MSAGVLEAGVGWASGSLCLKSSHKIPALARSSAKYSRVGKGGGEGVSEERPAEQDQSQGRRVGRLRNPGQGKKDRRPTNCGSGRQTQRVGRISG